MHFKLAELKKAGKTNIKAENKAALIKKKVSDEERKKFDEEEKKIVDTVEQAAKKANREVVVDVKKLNETYPDREYNYNKQKIEPSDEEMKNLNIETIFEDQNNTKFNHHSMCLTLKHIQVLYKFFGQYKNEFCQKSKQSVCVLTDDIDYMDKEGKIFQDNSNKNTTQVYRMSKTNYNPQAMPLKKYHITFFPFYKMVDKSNKIEQKNRDQLKIKEQEQDIQVTILKKNLRNLLLEIDDIQAIQHLVQSKNNILDIRRCILQVSEKERLNKS